MKVILKQCCRIDKQVFKKSPLPQEMDDKLLDHWFVKGLMKDGDLKVVEEEQKPSPKAANKAAKSARSKSVD